MRKGTILLLLLSLCAIFSQAQTIDFPNLKVNGILQKLFNMKLLSIRLPMNSSMLKMQSTLMSSELQPQS